MASDPKGLGGEIQAALKKQDWATGIRLLKDWCESNPEDSKGWYLRAYALYRLGRPGQAERAVKKALTLDPGHRDSKKLLTHLSRQLGTTSKVPFPARKGLWRKEQVIDGRYEIRGSKRGGMGEVYFAFDRELDRMVAIKTPLPEVFESVEAKARFLREAEAWIGLGIHPNICSAYYLRELDGLLRLFIEYVDGGSLDGLLGRGGGPIFRERLDLAIQIAAGMSHTHTFPWKDENGLEHRGLVHRDLKPANVLMEADGTARVTDFGLVGRSGAVDAAPPQPDKKKPDVVRKKTRPAADRAEGSEVHWRTITAAGAAMGTPPYMAPEQWRSSHQVGFPADIYAFGCLMYEIFCGRRPFYLDRKFTRGLGELQLYHWEKIHLETSPPPPMDLNPDLDQELSELMIACLAKEPSERPASFTEIREKLKSIYRRVEGWRVPFMRPEPKASRLVSDALNNQGVSYLTLGRTDRAVEAWAEALRNDPHHIEATYNTVLHAWRYSGLSSAEVCRRLVEIGRTHTSSWQPLRLLGRMQLYFGQYEAAAASLKKAADMEPDAASVLRDLGLALCGRAGLGDDPSLWGEAERVLSGALLKGRDDPQLAAALYLSRKRQGRAEEARQDYDRTKADKDGYPAAPDEAVYFYAPGQRVLFSISLPGPVSALAVGDGGRRAVLGRDDGLESWALHPVNPDLTGSAPTGPGFIGQSLSGDAGLALLINPDGKLCLWAVESGGGPEEISDWPGKAAVCALGGNGAFAAAAGPKGGIDVYDIGAGRRTGSIQGPAGVTALACGPQGQLIMTGAEDGTLDLWDSRNGQRRFTFKGHQAGIETLIFSPDGRWCLSGDREGYLGIWDALRGERVGFHKLEGAIRVMAVSPDSRLLLLALSDTASPETTLLTLMVLSGITDFVPGHVLARPMSAARIKDLEKEYQEKMQKARDHLAREYFQEAFEFVSEARAVEGYHRDPEAMEISRELAARFPNKSLVSAWEQTSFEGREPFTCLVMLPDRRILTGDRGGRFNLWDLESGACQKVMEGHKGGVASVAADGRGSLAVSAGEDGQVRLWDLVRGRFLKTLEGLAGKPGAVAMTPDGRYAMAGGDGPGPIVWDLKENSSRRLKGKADAIRCLAMGPDGRFAVSGDKSGAVLVWDLERSACREIKAGHDGGVTVVSVSPDGLHALSGGEDKILKYWELGGDAPPRVFMGHQASIAAAMVGPEGRWILSGGEDMVMRLWHLKDRKCVRVFEGHHQAISAVTFAPAGDIAVSAGLDRIIRLWHLDWEPEVLPLAFWDEKARPSLEIFLTLKTPYHKKGPVRKGKPVWDDGDFKQLLKDLQNRGFGFLRPHGVRRELEEMSYYWNGPLETPQGLVEKLSPKSILTRPFLVLFNTVKGQLRNLSLLVPAVLLVLCMILFRKHAVFPVGALLTLLYFIIRIFVRK